MLLCLPYWAFPQGYPLLNRNLPCRLLLPLHQQWPDLHLHPSGNTTCLTGWRLLPHLWLPPMQLPRSHSTQKWKEEMPLHKALTRSQQEAFSRDSQLVCKAREKCYWENHLHFNSKNSCNLMDVFWNIIESVGLLGSEIYEIQDTWTWRCKLEYANYALKTLPKGLKFFHPMSPSESLKVMGLPNIHHPDALHHFNRVTHSQWCGKEGKNKGMIINHLWMMHYKLGLVCKKCFCCPLVTSKAIRCHGWKSCQPSTEGDLMSRLHWPNHKHHAHWINIPKTGPEWRIRRRIQHLLDHHIGDTLTPWSGTGWRFGWRNCLPSNWCIHIFSIFLHPTQTPVMWGCLPHRLAPLCCPWWNRYCQPKIWCEPMYPTPVGHLISDM